MFIIVVNVAERNEVDQRILASILMVADMVKL